MPTVPSKQCRREALLVFALGCLSGLLYYAAYWPGYPTHDARQTLLAQARGAGCLQLSWESHLYACAVYLTSRLAPHLAGLYLLHIGLGALVSAYGYLVFSRTLGARGAGWLAAALAVFSPAVLRTALFTEREIVFAWVCLAAFLQLIDLGAAERGRRERLLRILGLSVTVLLASGLRREGALFGALLPFQLVRLRRISRSGALFLAVLLVAGWILLNRRLPRAGGGEEQGLTFSDSYVFTNAIINPLSYVLVHRGTPLSPEEREIFKRALRLDELERIQSDSDFPRKLSRPTSPRTRLAVSYHAVGLFLRHPGLFLENRLKLMEHTLGAPGLDRVPAGPRYLTGLRFWLDKVQGVGRSTWIGAWLWRPCLGVILCLAVLLFPRALPLSFTASLPFTAYLLVVFFFQGAPKQKYLFPLYLYSLFLIPLLWREAGGRAALDRAGATGARLKARLRARWENGWRERTARVKLAGPAMRIIVSVAALLWLMTVKPLPAGGLAAPLLSASVWALFAAGHGLVILLMAIRWRLLIAGTGRRPPGLGSLFLTSWVSQGVGLVLFGIVGADAYRFRHMVSRLSMPAVDAGRTLLRDRLVGVGSLVYLLAVLWLALNGGLLALPFAVAPWLRLRGCRREAVLSVLAHAVKIAMLLALYHTFKPLNGWLAYVRAFSASVGLLVEKVPLSWEGLGVGNLAFTYLSPKLGHAVYSAYFAGKAAFKLLGLGLLGAAVLYRGRRRLAAGFRNLVPSGS